MKTDLYFPVKDSGAYTKVYFKSVVSRDTHGSKSFIKNWDKQTVRDSGSTAGNLWRLKSNRSIFSRRINAESTQPFRLNKGSLLPLYSDD